MKTSKAAVAESPVIRGIAETQNLLTVKTAYMTHRTVAYIAV